MSYDEEPTPESICSNCDGELCEFCDPTPSFVERAQQAQDEIGWAQKADGQMVLVRKAGNPAKPARLRALLVPTTQKHSGRHHVRLAPRPGPHIQATWMPSTFDPDIELSWCERCGRPDERLTAVPGSSYLAATQQVPGGDRT